MKLIDLTGKRYGRLVVIERANFGDRHIKWVCVCDCGNRTTPHGDALKIGLTASCGCIRAELVRQRCITHGNALGYKSTPELRAWQHAKARCVTKTDAKYKNYGGRGIRMCDEWLNNPSAFLSYVGKRPPGCTLDRIRVHGDYAPGNVRWATPKQQANNKVNSRMVVDSDNAILSLKQFAEKHSLNYKSLWRFLKDGNLLSDFRPR